MLRQAYNGFYKFLYSTAGRNPFIPKTVNGHIPVEGHIRLEQETNPQLNNTIVEQLQKEGVSCRNYIIDKISFEKYLKETEYPTYYSTNENFKEKALEHFVTIQLLKVKQDNVILDVGAGNSPFSSILSKQFYANAYALDIRRTKDASPSLMLCKASELPFNNESVNGITLHCSFEHFEGNEDILFIKEAQRILKRGGICVIAPIYISSEYTIHLDPVKNFLKGLRPDVTHDPCAAIRYCDSRQPFSRHYDVETFKKRIVDSTALEIQVLHVTNYKHVDPDCYLRFICIMTKP